MKKVLAVLSVLAFLGVYAAPALTMPQEVVAKVVAVDKNKKKATAKKADVKTEKAACCSEQKSCASECKTSSACKGETKEVGVKEEKK